MDEILVIKKKPQDERLHVKVVKRMKAGYAPESYSKTVNFHDSNQLALFFTDLKQIFGAPVEKAFRKFQEEMDTGGGPFW